MTEEIDEIIIVIGLLLFGIVLFISAIVFPNHWYEIVRCVGLLDTMHNSTRVVTLCK